MKENIIKIMILVFILLSLCLTSYNVYQIYKEGNKKENFSFNNPPIISKRDTYDDLGIIKPVEYCNKIARLVSKMISGYSYTSENFNLSNNFSYSLGSLINKELSEKYLMGANIPLLNDSFNFSSNINIKNVKLLIDRPSLTYKNVIDNNINYSLTANINLNIGQFLINNIKLFQSVTLDDFNLTNISIPIGISLILSLSKYNGGINIKPPNDLPTLILQKEDMKKIEDWIASQIEKLRFKPNDCGSCNYNCSWYDIPCYIGEEICKSTTRPACENSNQANNALHMISEAGIAEAILRQSDTIKNNIKNLLSQCANEINKKIPYLIVELNKYLNNNINYEITSILSDCA